MPENAELSVERQAAHALKWSVLGKGFTQALSWVITIIVLRLLEPADYGLVAIVSTLVTALTYFSELGLGASIVQARELPAAELRQVTGLVMAFNLVIGAMMLIGAPGIAHLYGSPDLEGLLRLASLHFVFAAVSTVPQALAYRSLKFKRLVLVDVAAALLSSLVTLLLALSGSGAYALMIGSVLMTGTRAVFLFDRASLRIASPGAGITKLVRFGGMLTVNRVVRQLVDQSDIMIGAAALGSASLGVYSISLHFATLPMQKIMGAVNQIAFSAVARLQGELERLRMRLLSATRLLALAAVPTLWGISATAPESVPTILGDQWRDAVFPLQVIGFVTPLRMLQMVLTTAAVGMGAIRLDTINAIASAAVFPAAFALGCLWGVNGLAVSWVLAVPIVFMMSTPPMASIFGISTRDLLASARAPLAAGVLMYGAVLSLRPLLMGLGDLQRLGALCVAGAVVYVVAVFVLDRRVLTELRSLGAALK